MKWYWRNAIISSVIGLAVFLFIFYSETGLLPDPGDMLLPLLTSLLLFNGLGAAMYFLNRKYNKLLPWNRNITVRFILEVVSGLLLLVVASLIFGALFLNSMITSGYGDNFWQEYWDGIVKFGIISLVIIYIYSMINFSIFSYNQYSVHQIDRLRAGRNQLNLQFEALRTQLSPHFLFNALNTISSLIYKDILQAEDFIRRLAHTYRYILRTNDEQLVSLQAEMDMLNAYFYMQQIKYGECIELQVKLTDRTVDSLIPPLTLQMLLENALKHNLISEDRKLMVEIGSTEGYLEVKNNIIPRTELLKIGNNLVDRPQENGSHKIGINNIRQRYAFFTNRKVEVSKDRHFIVKLPIIYPVASESIL